MEVRASSEHAERADRRIVRVMRRREQYPILRVRKNVYNLTDVELNDLRNAYEGLYKVSDKSLNDERGYQWIAGVHGLPAPIYCQHGNLNFPTWHRAYIYEFELRLQDQVPSVTLPYWDWTSKRTATEGIPKAFSDKTYVDLKTGETKPNPLYSAYSQVTKTNTVRHPGPLSEFAILQSQVAFAQGRPTYTDYSPALENPHGGLHVWVGGDMGSVPIAAYDPIFWVHHCNVDRYWAEWQETHGNATVPDAVLQFICAPFTYRGEETLKTENFGYIYAESVDHATMSQAKKPEGATPEALLPDTMQFDLKVDHDFTMAQLEFHLLQKTEKSYQIRVYCDSGAGSYDASSGHEGNKNYANTLYLFGHGPCTGAEGHCDPEPTRAWFDLRPPNHREPFNTYLDVTNAVKEAVANESKQVALSFVVLDEDGKQVPSGVIEFDTVSLVTYK